MENCESKLLEFGDGAVKYARLEYSSDAESAINSFLDQELHSCLKTLLPTSGYPHLDEYNEADAKLEKAIVSARCSRLWSAAAQKYAGPWARRMALVSFNHSHGIEAVTFKKTAVLEDLPGPDMNDNRTKLQKTCALKLIDAVIRKRSISMMFSSVCVSVACVCLFSVSVFVF